MSSTQTSPANIRPATISDFDRIWEIFHTVIKTGDTYAYSPDTPKEYAGESWFGKGVHPYVAIVDGKIEGTYIIKANQPGLGSHVANASFMVDPATKVRGIGTQMGRHALAEAKHLGFQAMQFNFVISTNERAIELWKRLGFKVIGTAPKAYRHATLGFVDALIMHRFLD